MEEQNLGDLNLEGLGDVMGEYFGGDQEEQEDGHYCDGHMEEQEAEPLGEEYAEEEVVPHENPTNPQPQIQRPFNPNPQPRQTQGPGWRQQQNNYRPQPGGIRVTDQPPPPRQPVASNKQAIRQPAAAPVPAVQYPPPGTAVWNSDLFSCFDDIPLCCLSCWCPCIAFGRIAEIVDKGATSFTTSAIIYAAIAGACWLQFVYSFSYRNKIRLHYGIAGDDFEDYCTHLWCESCALTQEYKELTARGYNLPLGWHVNAAMQKQARGDGIQMPPRAPPGMTR